MSAGELLGRAAELRRGRIPFVHARVVLAERPTSAKPGDEAIVLEDGSIEGFVGGNCVEATLRVQSLRALEGRQPLLVRVSPTEEPPQSGRVSVVNPCLSGGTLEIFLEPVMPAPLVAIHGHSPTARALQEVGRSLGYQVVDWEPELTASAVVVASHGRDEEPVLEAALRAGVPYVALVASQRRGRAVVDSLDVDPGLRERVRTPAGLDIGAHGPAEVALSILAEIIATRPRPEPSGEVAASPSGTTLDLVCGMLVAEVESSLTWEHEGVRYFFCGPGCRSAFQADPAAYLPS
ncbi:MAG: XdhC family protein [Candidatus Dormibacteria bacterium]